MRLTLRAKLAWWSAAVTALALITFGVLAAINLRAERAEARTGHETTVEAGEPSDDATDELITSYLLAAPAVVLVVAAGSWWVARKAMRPMEDITRAIAAITADSLGEHRGSGAPTAFLPAPKRRGRRFYPPDEIGTHIQALNQMFDRLQRSFEQANRFTADASHELRTPLTIIRGEVEHALRYGKFDGEQEKLIVGILEEVGGLQRIVDTLLLLSRFDAGGALPERTAVDLSALVADAAQDTELLAESKQIRVASEVTPGLAVDGDGGLLRRLLLNLCDNAVRYNRERGAVEFRLRAEDGQALFSVVNTGVPLPSEQQGNLFKRFLGRNLDRPGGASGTGLGLSLAQEIAHAHGGAVRLVATADDRTEFEARIPLRR